MPVDHASAHRPWCLLNACTSAPWISTRHRQMPSHTAPVVKVDQRIMWHYTTTLLRLRIGARLTRYQNCKFHNFARTISRHADGISRYSVPPSAGPLLPLHCIKITLYWLDTHTHPFNGPLSGTTQVSRYQKGKTNLIRHIRQINIILTYSQFVVKPIAICTETVCLFVSCHKNILILMLAASSNKPNSSLWSLIRVHLSQKKWVAPIKSCDNDKILIVHFLLATKE